MKKQNVAIVGATGMVGQELIKIIEEKNFPVEKIKVLASLNSLGRSISFQNQELKTQNIEHERFEGMDFVFFCTDASVSEQYIHRAIEAGAFVIDKSSLHRMSDHVPLVACGVNEHEINQKTRLVANPNCSTIELVNVLKPLDDAYSIKRVVVSTYQSVSGAGKEGIEELSKQVEGLYQFQSHEPKVFSNPIAFNLIPQIGDLHEDGFCDEEKKLMDETKKILGKKTLSISANVVRVPTFHCHGEAINVEFEKSFELSALIQLLSKSVNLKTCDLPTPLLAQGQDEVFVGRIRKDQSLGSAVQLFAVADNLRRGAALNAFEIMNHIVQKVL